MVTELSQAEQDFQQRLGKIAWARFNKPYTNCNFEQQVTVVNEAHKQIQFALDENTIRLAKLNFNLKKA